MPHSPTPDPAAPPETYRTQVAASIRDRVSGRRPRDPEMAGASTARLLLEGVVESVRVYRLHGEQKAREAGKKGGERGKREGRRGRRLGVGGDTDAVLVDRGQEKVVIMDE